MIRALDHFHVGPLLTTCIVLLGACDSDDILNPERSGDAVATLVTTGTDVSGAVLELNGVADVILTDGDAVMRRHGDRLRVVILLDAAGPLDFGVQLTSSGIQPEGDVLEVIDGVNQPIGSLTGFRLEFER